MKMKLLFSPTSPYARKVRVLAHERGLADRIEDVKLDPFTDPSALLQSNPLGKVPTLVTESGSAIYDSPVICAYLDAHPEAKGTALIPASGPERWAVLGAEALADGATDLAFGLTLENRKPQNEKSPTTAARWRGQLARTMDYMRQEIVRLPADLTLGHLAIACVLSYIDFRHPDFRWRDGRGVLADWYARIDARPSMAATVFPA